MGIKLGEVSYKRQPLAATVQSDQRKETILMHRVIIDCGSGF
ncbi:hypothetical protein D1AOALGA4SA_8419 [Olavius algarvensis Delta 1 endosymbiont]|nr:hypothetical protein D1AOALGA4SA_8419 [Olavius algarvensis Delta 1 endosymbiont]